MSKMSQLHADLTEQAADLGFGSIEEAEANGYAVNFEQNKLMKQEDLMVSLSKAHEAWETQRQYLITRLTMLEDKLSKAGEDKRSLDTLNWTIEFLRGCRDGA